MSTESEGFKRRLCRQIGTSHRLRAKPRPGKRRHHYGNPSLIRHTFFHVPTGIPRPAPLHCQESN